MKLSKLVADVDAKEGNERAKLIAKSSRFLVIPYRLPYVRHLADFEHGFYVDFEIQRKIMGEWLLENKCKTALDIGAQTGGCIEYISNLGIRMDGTQYTQDLKNFASKRLKTAAVKSRLFLSAIDQPPTIPRTRKYDAAVMLSWFNLPFTHHEIRRYLDAIHGLLQPKGVLLFDYFQFEDVVVNPPETAKFDDGILFISHTELLCKVLRRYHFWIRGRTVRSEVTDLVDRTADEVFGLLKSSGFTDGKSQFLQLNYPRVFVLAKKA